MKILISNFSFLQSTPSLCTAEERIATWHLTSVSRTAWHSSSTRWGLMKTDHSHWEPIAEVRQRLGDWSDPVYCLPLRIRLRRQDDRRTHWGAHPLWHVLHTCLLWGKRSFQYSLQDYDKYWFQQGYKVRVYDSRLYFWTKYVMNEFALLFFSMNLTRPLVALAASSLVRRVLQQLQTTPVEETLVGSVSTSGFAMDGWFMLRRKSMT